MKVTVSEAVKEAEYPCLKRAKLTGSIVLFVGKDRGVYLKVSGYTPRTVGSYSETIRESDFEPFKGRIVIDV